jgi:mono/diheme cytochrome c family protein
MRIAFCALVLVSFCLVTIAARSSSEPNSSQIARGRYLVNAIAGCGDCHTPRLQTGAPDGAHMLKGTRLFFAPIHPIPQWADTSPPIAGLPGLTEQQVVTLLETGKLPNGVSPNPPMPTYHMTPKDAQAVAEYLKSLTPNTK